MKRTKFFNLLIIGLALTCVVGGCKKKPVGVTPIPGRTLVVVQEPGPVPPIEPGKSPGSEPQVIPLNQPGSFAGWTENAEMFKTETVYFDFDRAAIKSSEKSKIETVAAYLKGNSSAAVKVEGHCDERGTEEYNRSLGDRRALAVREELIRLGVMPERIDTISYGKDRPVELGHNEAAWKKNRRGVFILLTPPK